MEKIALTKADQQRVTDLEPHLANLIAFVDKTIVGDVRMTASMICQAFSKEHPELKMSEEDFVPGFRALVRTGKITGLGNARKFGYCRASEETEIEEEDDSSLADPIEPSDRTEVYISNKYRIAELDRMNWGLQKKGHSDWQTIGYYSKLKDALEGAASRVVDMKLKDGSEVIKNLSALKDSIVKVEQEVVRALQVQLDRKTA